MGIERLKVLEDEMKKCFRCSLCKMVPLPVVTDTRYMDCCPANMYYHFHGYSGSGKSIMGMSLLDGRIEADRDLAEIVFGCTACGYCDVSCKFIMEAERHAINMAFREYLVELGLGPAEHREAVVRLSEGRASVAEDVRAYGVKVLPEARAEVLVLGGAGTTAVKLARLLKHAGVDAGVLGAREPDTGLLAYWTGYREEFRKRATELTELVEGLGVKTLVAVSGSDFGMLKSKYPEYARGMKVQVKHAVELLDELIGSGRLKLTRPVRRRVTYHDPCYLGRQSEPPVAWQGEYKVTHGCMPYTDPPRPVNRGVNGVFDAPRRILKAIEGLEFREMVRVREYAYCCGGGGGAPLARKEMSGAAARNRIQEARDAGAEELVTACHQCAGNLIGFQEGETFPVRDIVDLAWEAANL